MRKLLQLGILALAATSAFALDDCQSTGQTVVAPCVAQLSNGFAIRHVRREVDGPNVRLYVTDSSYTEVPASSISGYERDETPAPPPLVAALPAPAPAVTIDDHITRASLSSGVDADFIRSVIQAESGAHARAVSPKGAQGLMQLMPATAAKLGVKDSFDPAANIDGGSRYLRDLLVQYHGDAAKALAAYNAGPQRVEQYHGVPPYSETRHYVANVIRDYNRRKTVVEKTAEKIPATSKPATKTGA